MMTFPNDTWTKNLPNEIVPHPHCRGPKSCVAPQGLPIGFLSVLSCEWVRNHQLIPWVTHHTQFFEFRGRFRGGGTSHDPLPPIYSKNSFELVVVALYVQIDKIKFSKWKPAHAQCTQRSPPPHHHQIPPPQMSM